MDDKLYIHRVLELSKQDVGAVVKSLAVHGRFPLLHASHPLQCGHKHFAQEHDNEVPAPQLRHHCLLEVHEVRERGKL